MAGQRILLIGPDIVVRHSGEIIVGLVIFAYVVDAETEIFALAVAPLGRPMRSRTIAPRVVARRMQIFLDPVLLGLHPNAVKDFGIQFHEADYGQSVGPEQEIRRCNL